jgi:ribosomal 50S subunit-recycling heat shock protein
MCDARRVTVNGSEARAGREVRVGDTVEVQLLRRRVKFRVRLIPAHAPGKEGGREMLELLEDRRNNSDPE